MRHLRHLLIATLIGLVFCGCGNAAETNTGEPMQATKGVLQGMKTYYMGRFAIDLPETFELEIQSQKIRYAEVYDFYWNLDDRATERGSLWRQKMAKIESLELPTGRKQIIVEEKTLKDLGVWAKAVKYYGDQYAPSCTYWTILIDYGNIGMWLTLDGEDDNLSIRNFNNILQHYRSGFSNLTRDSFCLNHGIIELPYLEQESTYVRFAGPMGMKLEIDMNETHEVEKAGLLESFAASVATNFAPGLDVDKIRGGKRMVAGLAGEEIVTKLTADMEPKLYFGWKYQGKKDSGEHPEIRIAIQKLPDGDLNEKFKIWDCALDSFKPVYNQ